jgi:Uma2 family endonuclease
MAITERELNARRPRPVDYPESDGKPMGETDWHVQLTMEMVAALRLHFQDREDVYSAGNNFIYFEEGNPKARVSPDSYVVFGVPNRLRRSYFTWREGGRTPEIVFEFTSRKTKREDAERKFRLYQDVLRVPEYVMFDPDADFLKPRLRLFRLARGVYQAVPVQDDRAHSDVLNLDLVPRDKALRLSDAVTGKLIPDIMERMLLAQAEAQRAEAETSRAEEEARRAEVETRRAEEEARRAKEEARRAEQESRRANDAEAEIERLKAELARLKGTHE